MVISPVRIRYHFLITDLCALIFVLWACDVSPQISPIKPLTYQYRVKAKFPHDPEASTQGLIFHDGFLFESTGKKGQSTLRKVDLQTGSILKIHRLSNDMYGEGLTRYKNSLVQLTWKNNTGFVYDLQTFSQLKQFRYKTEGWGLTTFEDYLVMSDGSSLLRFLDPFTYKQKRCLKVLDDNGKIEMLNELETINGLIYANVFLKDSVVMIDPATGFVVGRIDFSGLRQGLDKTRETGVLNGIAFDIKTERLFVTGKRWPWIFEIDLFSDNGKKDH